MIAVSPNLSEFEGISVPLSVIVVLVLVLVFNNIRTLSRTTTRMNSSPKTLKWGAFDLTNLSGIEGIFDYLYSSCSTSSAYSTTYVHCRGRGRRRGRFLSLKTLNFGGIWSAIISIGRVYRSCLTRPKVTAGGK